jgi:hypothetical protein
VLAVLVFQAMEVKGLPHHLATYRQWAGVMVVALVLAALVDLAEAEAALVLAALALRVKETLVALVLVAAMKARVVVVQEALAQMLLVMCCPADLVAQV